MTITRSELAAPTKLVGFVVGSVLLFFLALFVGNAIGPDASDTGESSPAVHESHDGAASNGSTLPPQRGHIVAPTAGTYALETDFQHEGVVRTATLVIEVEGNQG